MNYTQRPLLDWRTNPKLGIAHYGVWRVLLVGKLCIFLWKV